MVTPKTRKERKDVYSFIKIDGHYLNLPILEKGHVVGMVDVLKLTYATLEQVKEEVPYN